MAVRILEDRVVNQIAAGEVVERPASVVKELVENALDAGATTVDVTLREGGIALVRVVDDGKGMDRDDAMLCIERHATSKIRLADDIASVATLGFRGEALPSIASVSRFELTTRLAGAEIGTRIRLEGGKLVDVTNAAQNEGTDIQVRSLFFNLPVRRRFLRTTATELAHCTEAVVRQAMARPDVDFRIRHGGREVLRAPVTDDLACRVADLLNERELVAVNFQRDGVSVTGLVCRPGVHRSTAKGAVYTYVNGRFVQDRMVRRGVSEAYVGLLPRGRHPVVVIDVRVPDGTVDVNVHPTKVEVRFTRPFEITEIVAAAIRSALEAAPLRRADRRASRGLPRPEAERAGQLSLGVTGIPVHPDDDPMLSDADVAPTRALAMEVVERSEHAALPSAESSTIAETGMAAAPNAERVMPAAPFAEDRPRERGRRSSAPQAVTRGFRALRPLGMLADDLLVCAHDDELFVVDWMAARAVVLAARLRSLVNRNEAGSRPFLVPEVVRIAEGVDAEKTTNALGEAGFQARAFSSREVAVFSVPAILQAGSASAIATAAVGAAGEGPGAIIDAVVRASAPLEPPGHHAILTLLADLDELGCARDGDLIGRWSVDEIRRRMARRG